MDGFLSQGTKWVFKIKKIQSILSALYPQLGTRTVLNTFSISFNNSVSSYYDLKLSHWFSNRFVK